MRKFEELIVTYHSDDIIPYPEYKGKPYFSIKYEENGEHHVGYGTYNPQVLSDYIKDYFINVEEEFEKLKEEIKKQYSFYTDYGVQCGCESSCEIIDKRIKELKGETNG